MGYQPYVKKTLVTTSIINVGFLAYSWFSYRADNVKGSDAIAIAILAASPFVLWLISSKTDLNFLAGRAENLSPEEFRKMNSLCLFGLGMFASIAPFFGILKVFGYLS